MLNKNKVSKLTWDFFEVTKEIAKRNLVTAVNTKQINVNESLLPAILGLIDVSVNEGFNKGHNNFLNALSNMTEEQPKKKK
jgi:hypothetical protein